MILCPISQFSSQLPYLDTQLIHQYQISDEEFDFIQIIHQYEHQTYDTDLTNLIERFEQLFDNINITRLVALKLLGYHHQVPPLRIDTTLLENYQNNLSQQSLSHNHNLDQQILKIYTPNILANSTPPTAAAVNTINLTAMKLDPVLQVAAGAFSY